MSRTVSLHQIEDLAKGSSKDEILLQTKENTELHIIVKDGNTIIKFPFGNQFNVIDGEIIIKEIFKK